MLNQTSTTAIARIVLLAGILLAVDIPSSLVRSSPRLRTMTGLTTFTWNMTRNDDSVSCHGFRGDGS